MAKRRRLEPEDERLWCFHCPECGFGHTELGALVGTEEIYCEICFSEDGRHIRLRRWIAVEETGPGVGSR